MEKVAKKECSGCQKIQGIVTTNEHMLQEQIRLIKHMHEEAISLKHRNQQLKNSNAQLKEQLDRQMQKQKKQVEQGQQTDEDLSEGSGTNDRFKGSDDSLRVSTRVNIKGVGNSGQHINKENIKEILPIHMIRKDEEYFSRKRKNSYEQQHNASYWLKILQSRGRKLSPGRLREKTVHLIKKMIPHEIRHTVWPAVCSNSLALTDELYFELLERKNMGWVSKEVKSQIQKDIARSFSVRDNFGDKEGLRIEVSEVLELFHLYRPDVSYVQGMTYPNIVLTLIVGKVKAFQMFSNLVLGNIFFKRMYMFEPNFIQAVAKAFQLLLFDYQYELADKLAAQNIDPQLFLVEWFYTMFSRALSFDGTLKLWDQLLYYGEVVLFRMALAIFELVKPHILETNYEDTVGLTQGFASYVREDKLLDLMVNHKLSEEKLNKYIEKAQRGTSSYKAELY